MKLFTLAFVGLLAAFLALPQHVTAQNKKFTLEGKITDSVTRQPVKGAVVVVAGSKYVDTTEEDGTYIIEKMLPGTNNLLVYAAGFDTTVVRFEIRKNMRLDATLFAKPKPDEMAVDTAKKDSGKDGKPIPAVVTAKKKKGLTEEDKDEMKVLIEDAVFSKNLFFSKFKDKKKSVYVEGSFWIDTGFLYEFEAKFNKKADGFELAYFEFTLKGKR